MLKHTLLILLQFFMLTEMTGQLIDIYYPYEKVDPQKIDGYGGEYEMELRTIIGIVSAESQGADAGRDDYDTQVFRLRAWKWEDLLYREDLIVLRTIEKTRDFFDDIPKYAIVRLDLYLNRDKNRAVMLGGEVISSADQELLAIQKQLQQDVILSTKGFGDFKLNKDINVFERELEWNGAAVELVLDVESEEAITDELETLKTMLQDSEKWEKRIRNYMIDQLLPLKNESWLEAGEAKWTRDQFLKKVQLESIWISKGGEFEFWHDDGDIFWGHAILIRGNLEKGPYDADIPG